ncbi:Transposon Tf2-12 polyprotein [Trametes pubescens]|uniref:RNA-directed DNA polymerase n=1 Tax=Trametes pubescens TaxID=154538 RepID=A0A1M2W7W8_TRAPU|nr:Transposon Tf2-12 polyprotein [Trametes pubescens]
MGIGLDHLQINLCAALGPAEATPEEVAAARERLQALYTELYTGATEGDLDDDGLPDLVTVAASSSYGDQSDGLPELDAITNVSEDENWTEPEADTLTDDFSACSSSDSVLTDEVHDAGGLPSSKPRLRLELPRTRRDGRRVTALGDLYAECAEQVLLEHGPYCCEAADMERGDEYIPNVYRTTPDLHVIMHWRFDVLVESQRLQDPNFDLPRWYRRMCVQMHCQSHQQCFLSSEGTTMGHALAKGAARTLEREVPWPDSIMNPIGLHFLAQQREGYVRISDLYLDLHSDISNSVLENTYMDLPNFYACLVQRCLGASRFELQDLRDELRGLFRRPWVPVGRPHVLLNAVGRGSSAGDEATLIALQRNASAPRDFKRLIPEPAVVVVHLNGHPAQALIDSGSLSDFMSSKFAHQIGVGVFELTKPLPVHLAVQGSRTKINYGCRATFEYQRVKAERYFDIINLLNYDLILGTPFLFQHCVTVGLNPTTVVVGSTSARPIEGKQVRVLQSHADILEDRLEGARTELREYAASICKEASDSPLTPLRTINHCIPLVDTSKIYLWRPSKCPDTHRASWVEKRDAYLKSGRWHMTTARNTSLMLLLTKPGTGVKGVPPKLRVVCDLRERNANTHKVTSPLPDMEGILQWVSRKPYRSLIDGKDTYEQIRVEPEHVERMAMTTPDGNMVSLVLQQGDCNAVATYQSLMNYLFGPYIGVFLDVYLDDIAIYSDTLSEHIAHVNATKLHFLCREMKVLGRIVDNEGIRMDPDKVDSILNWKVPTNKELLRGFLGSVGYLANDIATVRIPMGILASMTGSDASFKWDFTQQRAFDEIKRLVHVHREHHRHPLDYSPSADRIWLVTDGSHGRIAGVVTQGASFRTGRVAAFFSAKLSSAQSNYPVHEIEMLAGVEAMMRHRDILLGCAFTWVTDHKGLVHLLSQRNLPGRQAQWLEKISKFNFNIEYLPGVENVLADTLSRIYSNDQPGTVRAASKYTEHDDGGRTPTPALQAHVVSVLVLVDAEGRSSGHASIELDAITRARARGDEPPRLTAAQHIAVPAAPKRELPAAAVVTKYCYELFIRRDRFA